MLVKQFILYGFRYAPWAVLASLCAGLSNYLIIILLSQYYGLTTGGEFRLLLSIVGLLSLFTLAEADKVVIRHLVTGKQGVVRPLVISRMQFSLIGTVVGTITAAFFYQKGQDIWLGILTASLLLPLAFPADLYEQIVQSRNNFRMLALYSVIKYTILTSLAFLAGYWSVAFAAFLVLYYAGLTALNIGFLILQPETFEPSSPEAPLYFRESIQLSVAGFFPVVLEHADKFLVAYFLGLEKLALYTIGISTGRMIAIVIKPTMSVYFPVLVKERFSFGLLLTLFLSLTVAGIIASWPLSYYFSHVLGAEYVEAFPLAAIVMAGLGVYFISVAMYYSSIYHKDAELSVPTMTSFFSTLVTLAYLLLSLTFGGQYALILSAASYPLRDLMTLILTLTLSKRAQSK
jgi:O-antigen/teichoic acid export membrane protein